MNYCTVNLFYHTGLLPVKIVCLITFLLCAPQLPPQPFVSIWQNRQQKGCRSKRRPFRPLPVQSGFPATATSWSHVRMRGSRQCEPPASVSHLSHTSFSLVIAQRGVLGGEPAHRELQNDRETLLQRTAAQEFWLWVRLLHAKQQEHVWAHLRIPTAVGGRQYVHTHTVTHTSKHIQTHTLTNPTWHLLEMRWCTYQTKRWRCHI